MKPEDEKAAPDRVLFTLPEHGDRSPGRVVLNWSGYPVHDLEWVAESYQKVANARVEHLSEEAQRCQGIRGGDEFEAYPIVFLYRQAFELMMKSIVLAGSVALHGEGVLPMPLKLVMRHSLTPLFQEICRILAVVNQSEKSFWDFNEDGMRTEEDFGKIVREFDYVDGGSYTFRYSITKDGCTATLERGFEFDLFAFAIRMDKILTALSGLPGWIRDLMQDKWEAAYDAQQEAWANSDPADYSY